MTRYESYKETGIDWISQIPINWNVSRSKFLFENKSLKNFPDEPLLSVTQRDGVVVRSESNMNVWNPTDDVSGYKLIESGDFVISLRSFEGGLELSEVKGLVSPAYTVLQTIKRIDDHYFRWLMKSYQFIVELNKHVTGIRQGKNIGWDDFSNIYLTIPSTEEQKLISRYIDKKTEQIDRLVAKIQKKIELLKEQRTALINQCVTKGLDPNVEMKDSGVKWIGEIPKHWKLSKVKYLSKVISKGTTPSTLGEDTIEHGEVRYLKSENIVDGEVKENPVFYISSETDELIKRSRLESGDVLVVIAGAMVGKSAILTNDFLPANTNQAVSFIRPILEGYSSLIQMWMSSTYIKMTIQQMSVVSAQPNLSMENLGNFKIPVPSEQEWSKIQLSINEVLKKNNLLSLKEAKKINLLKEYRQSLISSVVSGKVRVTEDMV